MTARILRSILPVVALAGCGGLGLVGAGPRGLSPVSHPTTSASIAMSNLDGEVEGTRERVADRGTFAFRESLVDLLLTRARFTGLATDFADAEATAAEALRVDPSGEALRLRARVHVALHRFADARTDLDQAERLGVDVVDARAAVDLAQGVQLDDVRAVREQRAEAQVSYGTLSGLAVAQVALGAWADADDLFVRAVEVYRDVSPLAVAWVDFQRGVLWAERAGHPEVAPELYRAAVERLPAYVTASVHLAELLDDEAAVALLRRVADPDGDPEPFAVLAERLQAGSEAAAEARRMAAAMYVDRLARWPLAYADHGAEFYMGAGDDPARALELAALNLDNRATDRAYDLAIRAAVGAGQADRACAWSLEAGADRPSVPLAETQASLPPRCR